MIILVKQRKYKMTNNTNDIKQKLHDGSFRVTQLGRHDSVYYVLPKPIEYSAKCLRLSITEKSDEWQDTADKWIITISNEVFEYYTGIGHRKHNKPVRPELGDVLHSLILDASACDESFEDWCMNFGYDTDSRKALEIYLSCQNIGTKLRKTDLILSDDLRDFLQEY